MPNTQAQFSRFSFRSLVKRRATWSRLTTIVILALIAYGTWRNWSALYEVFASLGPAPLAGVAILTILSLVLSALALTMMAQGMGYTFSLGDGYQCLNLSQIAAIIPGGAYGGLVGLLLSKKVSGRDSVLLVALNLAMMLSACTLVGAACLIPFIGWGYAVLCLAPPVVLIGGRGHLERIRRGFFSNTSPLPASSSLLAVFAVCILTWIISSASFVWLVQTGTGGLAVSPVLIASAYAAGYIAGFISIFAPSGLGVSEGVIMLLLGGAIGADKAFAAAVAFRIIQTTVQWLNIAVSLVALNMDALLALAGIRNLPRG